jgi:DNA-binding XRE family transcriptional regulator
MVKIKITNHIPSKIDAYRRKHGSTKAWLARQLGYNSNQALDGAMNSTNPTIETLAKFAFLLQCDIESLYDVEYLIDEDDIDIKK